MYSLVKPFLFRFAPETAHALTLNSLQLAHRLKLTAIFPTFPAKPCEFFGLNFSNRVGVAAGLDKNGDYIDGLATLGFGFIEIGSVTPKPQFGNPLPRMFRLVQEEAIINRMGFNSKGIDYVAAKLAKKKYRGVLGINIAKNRETPNEKAVDDYVTCFRRLWKYASYITVNVSSPNTPGLRDLQLAEALQHILETLKHEQTQVLREHLKYVPLVLKISPDLAAENLQDIARIVVKNNIDGVIATNTTISREHVERSPYAKEAGGLSGKPICELNTKVIQI